MEQAKPQANRFVRKMSELNHYLSTDLLGGPKFLKLSWVINFQKGGTFLWVAFLMYFYENYSTGAWVYMALHGSYGLCWLLKDRVLPDPNWERKVTIAGGLVAFLLVLGPYWSFAFLLISGVVGLPPLSNFTIGLAVTLHTLGVVIMMTADAQKYFTLKYKRGLITDGMFKYVRHPNYLGEMMLYGVYAILVQHWIPWVVLAWVWLGIFMINMLMKEASMSRYPEWAAYKAHTGMLLPPVLRLVLGGGLKGKDDAKAPSTPR
jgi:protein-S-isoprenylcysteine O-methyltransferase Ste14